MQRRAPLRVSTGNRAGAVKSRHESKPLNHSARKMCSVMAANARREEYHTAWLEMGLECLWKAQFVFSQTRTSVSPVMIFQFLYGLFQSLYGLRVSPSVIRLG